MRAIIETKVVRHKDLVKIDEVEITFPDEPKAEWTVVDYNIRIGLDNVAGWLPETNPNRIVIYLKYPIKLDDDELHYIFVARNADADAFAALVGYTWKEG